MQQPMVLLSKRLNYNTLEGVSLPLSATSYRRPSAHLLVASNTASTELRSGLSRISHVPVSNCASRPPSPCTATNTNLRSNASMICAPSSATELSGNSSSRQSDAARAAASTRLRTVSVPCSSASASLPSNESRTRIRTRCGRSEGRTSSPWKMTTRFLARVRTASSCISSMGRTPAVWATLILRWSILTPSCAISADSMFRTTCFGCMSLEVSTWISLTSPSGVTTTRAERIPVRPAIRFSARFTPHGSGVWAGGVSGRAPRSSAPPGVSAGLDGVTSPSSRGNLVASHGLGPVQRAVGLHEHVLALGPPPRRQLGHPDAHRHEALGIAQIAPHHFHAGAHLVGHHPRPLHAGVHQHHHELVAAIARREVGRPDVRRAFSRGSLQHVVPRLVAEPVVHLLEIVQIHEQHRERIVRAVAAGHLAGEAVAQHPIRGQPRKPVHASLQLRLPAHLVEIRRARFERGAPRRGRLSERAAGGVTARAAVPGPAVGREPDLLEHGCDRFGRRPVTVAQDRECLAYSDAARHGLLHHRPSRPRRLRRPHDLAPPEQLVRRPQERVFEAALARQDVHEPHVDAVHRHRPGDRFQTTKPAHLTEPPAGVRFLHQQLPRPATRRAQVPPPLLGHP